MTVLAQVPARVDRERNGGRLRVAQVVTRFQAGAGGVALRGAAALDPDAYDVTIVAGSGDRLLDEARAAGMTVVLVPDLVAPLDPVRDLRALRRMTALLADGAFDVVHTHSAKAGAVGRAAAHRAGVRRIVHTYHGFPFHEFQSAARRTAYIAVERRLSRITSAFLAVGTGVAVEAVRRGIVRPECVRTIGAVVSTDVTVLTPESRADARDLLGLPPDVAVVGTVGRLDYQKAPEHLLQALGRMRRKDVVVVWIGGGPQREQLQIAVERAGLSDRFRLVGERSDVATCLPAFDLFAMSSRYEGLPCAVVEAQTCGLPVVATAVNGVPDVVIPGETGLLVPPARPGLLAAAIEHMLDHPEQAARMARAGQVRLGDRYDPATLGEVLRACYREPGDDTTRARPADVRGRA